MATFLICLRRRWLRLLVVALLCAVLIPPALIAYVGATTRPHCYTDVSQVPPEQVALVFGAGVYPDGRLSRMLADRVRAAANLYHKRRVQKLLMSGDNSTLEYNEVAAMQRYAIELGVAAEDITLDYAGFSTYESCYRAREIFGVRRAVVVTQSYHLPRAVYTCQQLNIETTGLGTPDWGAYPAALMHRYTLREVLATLNALWQVHITRPLPTFLGPFEGIG
jgi:vancomycin permeability regulator SanA